MVLIPLVLCCCGFAAYKHYKRKKAQKSYFLVLKKLGSGGFGSVYRAKHNNKKEFALKFMRLLSPKVKSREMIPMGLKHKNIISVLGSWDVTKRKSHLFEVPEDILLPTFVIWLEICDDSLYHKLYQGKNVKDIKWKMSTFGQMLDGVEFLHSKNVVHRDLKPENILLKGDVVKITDFGLAKEGINSLLCDEMSATLGTPAYRAPEQHTGHLSNNKIDVFSLGIVLAEMWIGCETKRKEFLFWAEEAQNNTLSFHKYSFVPKNIQSIIINMTKISPNDRYSIYESRRAFNEVAYGNNIDLILFSDYLTTRLKRNIKGSCFEKILRD